MTRHSQSEKPCSGDSELSRTRASVQYKAKPHGFDLKGAQRFGEYDLLEEIARGGMGVVFRARQRRLKRIVAIKMIGAGELAGPEDVRRFHLEAEAAAQLHHPAIVPIYEVGEERGIHFFSMRFVDGKSLAKVIQDAPLPPRQAIRLMLTVCEAIEYANQHGVIHRDLKPGNILLLESTPTSDSEISGLSSRTGSSSSTRSDSSDDGIRLHPLVTDFGLAKQSNTESELTSTGQIIGTPSFMSPEQARGERGDKIGTATDIYGLGAVLYATLTGRPPFRAASAVETLRQVVEQEPVPPQSLNADIDGDLATVCLKCLEKDPSHRYASAGELADELRRIMRGEPIAAKPISTVARGWRWCQRNPAVAGLLITISTLLLLFAVGGPIVAWNQSLLRENADRLQRFAEAEAQRASDAAMAEMQARQSTRRYLYVAHMNLIQEAWDAGNVGRVTELLARHRIDAKDLRGFEWYYWWRLSHQYSMDVPTEHGEVNALAVSPDGETVATASEDTTVNLWDVSTGRLKVTLAEHTDHVRSVDFSPDGNMLASSAGDQSNPGQVILWDVTRGHSRHVLRGHLGRVDSVKFSPNGKMLATASIDGTVKLWEVASGTEKRSLETHTDAVVGLSFADQESMLASCSADGSVKLWNWTNGQLLRTIDVGPKVHAVALSPNGKLVAASFGTRALTIWDTSTGKPKRRLKGHRSLILCLDFAPNGQMLASSGADNLVKLWGVSQFELVNTLVGHTNYVNSLTFAPDSAMLISGGRDYSIKFWSVESEHAEDVLTGHEAAVRSVAFSPDGNTIASAGEDQTIRIVDAATGHLRRTLRGHSDTVRAVAFAPSGNLLASASADESVMLWDLDDDEAPRPLRGHRGPVTCIAFSHDGKQLASAGSDRTVRVWDVHTGQSNTLEGQTDESLTVDFSPDGTTLAAAGHCHSIMLWDVRTGQLKSSIPRNNGIRSVVFAPDGKTIASGGSGAVVNLYNVATGKLLATLKGHTGFIQSLAFSPDGVTLATGSRDATLRLWDLVSGEQKASFSGHSGPVYSVAFADHGSLLVSGGMDSTVRIWRAATKEDVHRYEQRQPLVAGQTLNR